mgnify:CR=1 FL=1
MKRLLALAAPLREIVVEGADPVLQALARAALPFGVGDEPQDLEAARRAILETGYFRDVRLALEGDVLKIVLVPNPPIAAVRVETEAFPEERLLTFLEQNFAIGKGATYNPVRAQEAAEALARAYRQAGFPFTPKVAVEAKEDKEGIALTFRVEERPEVKAVRLLGVSLLPEEELRKGLEALKGSFDFAKYQEALRAIAKRYEEAGYRFSGPDPEASTLEEGVLTVRVRELKVARVEGEGLAAMWEQRKALKRAQLKAVPAPHKGLGLPLYAQVTSPLRRYLDLVAHQQLRAWLKGERPRSQAEVLERVGAAEAVADLVREAERKSKLHWTLLHLEAKGYEGPGVLVERRGGRGVFLLPELGLTAQVALPKALPLNAEARLRFLEADLPALEARFALV